MASKPGHSSNQRNTVMIIDDHPLFRQGLRRLIEDGGRFTVVAEAATGYEAIRLADIHQPQVILSDIQLPGVTGLKIARILKKQHPQCHLIMLSMHMDDERLFDAVRAGASAYLTKDIEASDLIDSIARVVNGEQLINSTVLSRPQLARRMLNEFRALVEPVDDAPAKGLEARLSVREVEVLDCMAQGLSNKEIADALYISEQTVKNHITSVFKKLDVDDRVQAVLNAIRAGWVELGPTASSSNYSSS